MSAFSSSTFTVASLSILSVALLGGGYAAGAAEPESVRAEATLTREEARQKLRAMGITDENRALFRLFEDSREFESTEKIRLLIAAGVDVNQTDADGKTPLMWASLCGWTEHVKLLLAAGADANKADDIGQQPLHMAIHQEQTECVKLLLAAGVDVNKGNMYGFTPLIFVALHGDTEMVKLLLSVPGIDVNKADAKGRTPLYWAEDNGCTEIVDLLKAAGAVE